MLKSFNRKTTISSNLTFFYKFLFITIWIGFFGCSTLELLLNQNKEGFAFLAVWIVGTLFLYWECARLKYVEVDANNIYISNFFKTIKVPLQEIERISENSFINIHPIWISFKSPTDFGRKIMFMPKFSFRASFFCPHPIAKELCELASNVKNNTNTANTTSTTVQTHVPQQKAER